MAESNRYKPIDTTYKADSSRYKPIDTTFKAEPTLFKQVDTTSNPAPLGLLGFGMTTVLLNIHNAGVTPLDSMIIGMGIFIGGLAQVFAGIMEWKKGNTFGTTAFTAYGLFWMSLVAIWCLPDIFSKAIAPNLVAMGFYLTMWGIFTSVMFIGTLKLNRGLQVVFLSLTILFFLLALRDFTGSKVIGTIAGIEGVLCGFSAIYLSMAQVLNEVYGKVVLPIGPITEKRATSGRVRNFSPIPLMRWLSPAR